MLTIKDLSASKELDTEAMATVRGGTGFPPLIANSFNELFNETFFDNRVQENLVTQANAGEQVVEHNYGLVWQVQEFDNYSDISN
jgi:hypothetical protein